MVLTCLDLSGYVLQFSKCWSCSKSWNCYCLTLLVIIEALKSRICEMLAFSNFWIAGIFEKEWKIGNNETTVGLFRYSAKSCVRSHSFVIYLRGGLYESLVVCIFDVVDFVVIFPDGENVICLYSGCLQKCWCFRLLCCFRKNESWFGGSVSNFWNWAGAYCSTVRNVWVVSGWCFREH